MISESEWARIPFGATPHQSECDVSPPRPDEGDKSSVWLAYSHADLINEILNAISELPGVFDRIEAYLIGRGFEDARDDIEALRKAVF